MRDLYIVILEEILKNPDVEPNVLASEIAKAVREELMKEFIQREGEK